MAGHIDHGKSALVTALTGVVMDRLGEERRRGITIDLNFAPLRDGDDVVASMIDVPGHEDLVRTMVAGASGIDLALLVIAADDGIMPQTVEHLAVLEHLRVPTGIPVITRADLAPSGAVEALERQVIERLRSSCVRFEQPIATSARTGQGVAELRARIVSLARQALLRAGEDVFRIPIDRIFSVPGVGTVITGTSWSGSVAVGEDVRVLPRDTLARVRSVESHGRTLDRTEPRARTAVGLAGIDRSSLERGDVLVAARDDWRLTTAIDVELAVQTDAPRPISHHARVRVLVGTAEIMARVHCPLPIEPGGSGLARLALERPHVFRGGDRIVVRSYSPIATIGGGRVLDPLPPSRRTWATGLTDADPAVRLVSLIERRPAGVLVRSLAQRLGVAPERAVALAGAARGIRCVADRWVSATTVDSAAERALVLLGDFHASAPGSTGMPLETLRRSMDASDAVSEAALTDLQASRRIRLSGGTAALAGFKVVVQGGDDAVTRIARHIHEAGLSPPTIAELAATTGYADLPAVLRVAAERGLVERVEADRYYSVQALERVSQALLEAGRAGLISPAMLRDRLGVSRKYVIPLLEWADRRGITSREAGGRRIARQSPCGTRARD